MKKLVQSLVAIALVVPGLAWADEPVPRHSLGSGVIHGSPVTAAKAGGDTINLMAARLDPTNGTDEPLYYGDFEDAAGDPAWNGWTSRDLTAPEPHWQVSDYQQAEPGDLAAWCGDLGFPSCDGLTDPDGGYGNDWHDILAFQYTVGFPGSSTTLAISADVQLDVESGYDYLHLSVRDPEGWFVDLQTWTGKMDFASAETVTILPAEYLPGDVAAIYLRFTSDDAYSDEDCNHPTGGAVQIDDIAVHVENGTDSADYFTDFQDGTFGDWVVEPFSGVGDFAQIWEGLEDVDPCGTNYSPQVAFIDDGLVVPGTGGSDCINWCYGPAGYIVNTTGGLAGPEYHIDNHILSPVMEVPAANIHGARFDFTVYGHEDLSTDAPGIFFTWAVRSADVDGDGGQGIQDIADQPWRGRNIYSGGPLYDRFEEDVSYLLEPGWDQIQVRLGVVERGWEFDWIGGGWTGDDGYPAPYFDDVTLKVFPHAGPSLVAREYHLAQDGFPERGALDFEDLGSMNVRFDSATNISLPTHQRLDFGDSISVRIRPLRPGAEMEGAAELGYIHLRNPVFDPYRSAGLPPVGTIAGDWFKGGGPSDPDPEKWIFDLPDSGFLFPGDVLHYYVTATTTIDGSQPATSVLPADTTGFSTGFGDPLAYPPAFTFRALPTIREDGFGGYETPHTLFWEDMSAGAIRDSWHDSWDDLGTDPGNEFDIFYTNDPASLEDNGLGAQARTAANLAGYDNMVYSAGDLGIRTLTNGDFATDASPDLQVVRAWLEFGDRDLFMTGDDLASDLVINAGAEGLAFATDIMGITHQQQDVRSFIDNQASPVVELINGPDVFSIVYRFVAGGGCPSINTFDGVVPGPAALRLGEFTDPVGSTGGYPYSTVTWHQPASAPGSRVISMPIDLAFVQGSPDGVAGHHPNRTWILHDVMAHFGHFLIDIPVPGTPEMLEFKAANHPNPFNPATTIVFTVPKAGHLSLKVFDIRGMLVKTLVDGRVEAGADQVAVWDGTDQAGSAVSSGVYFYEARTGGEVKVGKMALLK